MFKRKNLNLAGEAENENNLIITDYTGLLGYNFELTSFVYSWSSYENKDELELEYMLKAEKIYEEDENLSETLALLQTSIGMYYYRNYHLSDDNIDIAIEYLNRAQGSSFATQYEAQYFLGWIYINFKENFDKGIYYLEIISKKQKITKKIVLE